MSVDIGAVDAAPMRIVLGVAALGSEITVTAQRGMIADVEETPPFVTRGESSEIQARPMPTLGNALEGAAGVMVQQSTYGQASPFLRGLTGYQVLNLIDGVRLNNTTFRSGPNQYLAFVDPKQVERIEAMLGPASSQFGSDALGGAIHVLTPARSLRQQARHGRERRDERVRRQCRCIERRRRHDLPAGGEGRRGWPEASPAA